MGLKTSQHSSSTSTGTHAGPRSFSRLSPLGGRPVRPPSRGLRDALIRAASSWLLSFLFGGIVRPTQA
jgi:hypothetical protein